MSRTIDKVDVICQHSADGKIIPIRFRLMNEDGEYETYTIKGYKNLSHAGVHTNPDGIHVTSNTYVFECNVVILDYRKIVRLYFDKSICKWRLTI